MVIFQAIGAAASFVRERDAKAEIKKIENANQAIKDACVAKVNANRQNITLEEKREQALQELQNENPIFDQEVRTALFKLVAKFTG